MWSVANIDTLKIDFCCETPTSARVLVHASWRLEPQRDADLKEVEEVIRANYDAVVEVIHTAPAEQYPESLLLGQTTA